MSQNTLPSPADLNRHGIVRQTESAAGGNLIISLIINNRDKEAL